MKLIIDVNETSFKQLKTELKNSPEYPNLDYCQIIIASGIPYEERPHGEWNYIQADMCICPFCGAMPHKLYKNYCAKCGANLRGKKADENS